MFGWSKRPSASSGTGSLILVLFSNTFYTVATIGSSTPQMRFEAAHLICFIFETVLVMTTIRLLPKFAVPIGSRSQVQVIINSAIGHLFHPDEYCLFYDSQSRPLRVVAK